MDAQEIQRYREIELKLASLGIDANTCGELFYLKIGKDSLGSFRTVDDLYFFICGYEAGRVAK